MKKPKPKPTPKAVQRVLDNSDSPKPTNPIFGALPPGVHNSECVPLAPSEQPMGAEEARYSLSGIRIGQQATDTKVDALRRAGENTNERLQDLYTLLHQHAEERPAILWPMIYSGAMGFMAGILCNDSITKCVQAGWHWIVSKL